jgi:hypothetical protein
MTPFPAVAILIGANHIGSDQMASARPLILALNDHILVSHPASYWDAEFSDPNVVLTASIEVLAGSPRVHPPGGMATTLAVQMDAGVAMQLYRQLGDLGRSMGWLMQGEEERPT